MKKLIKKYTWLIVASFIVFSTNSLSEVRSNNDDLMEQARQSHENGDINSAVRIYEQLYKQGDTAAAYELGMLYFQGKGVKQDLDKAFEYFRMSAEGGYEDSFAAYGGMYENGYGTKKDPVKAYDWFTKSANSNSSTKNDGKSELALQIIMGTVAKADVPKGIQILKELAEENHAKSQYALFKLYSVDKYVKKDPELALRYLKEASYELPQAAFDLGICYYKGVGVEKDLFKALYLLEEVANQGYSLAMVATAEMYRDGKGTAVDLKKAFSYYKAAADKDNPLGMYFIAKAYSQGKGVEKSMSNAKIYFEKSCKAGVKKGCNQLKNLKFK
jgi:TPR repeat protein